MEAVAQKNRICKLFFSLVFTGLFLAAIETASFILLELRPTLRRQGLGPQSSAYKGQPWARQYWNEENIFHATFVPYLMWGNPRSYHSETIVTDENGFRRTFNSNCNNDAFTIWMFGGSTMWGFGTPDWETIPSHLAADFLNSGRQVCVRNLGTEGFASTQEVIQLMLELTRSDEKPNLVIFYDGINEVYSLYESGKTDYPMGLGSVEQELRRATAKRKGSFDYLLQTNTGRLLSWMGESLGQRFQITNKQLSEAAVRKQAEMIYRQNTALVTALGRRYGFEYVFFWQPCNFIGKKQRSSEEQEMVKWARVHQAGLEDAHLKMDWIIRTQIIPHFFNITDVFDSQMATIYVDNYHLGPEGNRLVAAKMIEIVWANHLESQKPAESLPPTNNK